jgi:NAD(P)H-hydrate epimerase
LKPILTPEEAVRLDRATQALKISAAQLMERAGWAVARACVDLMGGTYGRRVVVVCGKGNNGGDGLVAARHLWRWGVSVDVELLEEPSELREPAGSMCRGLGDETWVRVRRFDAAGTSRRIGRADCAVDAVFGTGFAGSPEDEWAEAIEAINLAPAVVSVDIPSGVDGHDGSIAGVAVRADLTVTFGAAKTGVVLMPGAEHAGDVRVVDIGFPEDLFPRGVGLTEPADVAEVIPAREGDTHKRASGTLVVVAGSASMTGAAALVARGAERAGAGYVLVATPASASAAVRAAVPEAVFLPLPETAGGSVTPAGAGAVVERLASAHAMAIGPGLGSDTGTAAFIREVVRASPVPAVIDADGLNAFVSDPSALSDRKAEAVLTPHMGELRRLVPEVSGRLEAARGLSSATDAVALVKGTRTVIAQPSGEARINPTGSPWLATAGTGDVLTGVIGALLARGCDPFSAAWAGAYLHGLAGIVAGKDRGDGTVAGDVAEALPDAFSRVVAQA